jgi:hypothetical protein
MARLCVKDTAVLVTAVPRTQLSRVQPSQISALKTELRIIRVDIRHSWLHSGVIDTAVASTAVSLAPLCNQLCRFSPRIQNAHWKLFCLKPLKQKKDS